MSRQEDLAKIHELQLQLKKLDGAIEYTLAIIKPEGVKFKKQIISKIKNHGFSILKVNLLIYLMCTNTQTDILESNMQ